MRFDSSRHNNEEAPLSECEEGLWLVTHVGDGRVWLDNNSLETLPAELCVMLPNTECLLLYNNHLRTLSRELGHMQHLQM
jgi:hypothetical protein